MKNKRVKYKNNNIVIFLKGKKNYLSVELDEDDFIFQKHFFENYYNPTKNFLLKFVKVEENKLLFVFPSDFVYKDYSFHTKYNFLTDICKLKRLIIDNVDLEYNLDNFIVKEILELKQCKPIKINELNKIIKKCGISLENITEKFYINVASDLIFNKLLIHKRKDKFFFLDYPVFSISTSLQIEDSKKINYCEL